MSEVKRLRVTVTGRVQGVFFRDSCRQEARRLNVAGWVANEPDGSVLVEVEGPADRVDALVDWCREGPPHARVDRVWTSPTTPEGDTGFKVR
jgi:acylphosphatase